MWRCRFTHRCYRYQSIPLKTVYELYWREERSHALPCRSRGRSGRSWASSPLRCAWFPCPAGSRRCNLDRTCTRSRSFPGGWRTRCGSSKCVSATCTRPHLKKRGETEKKCVTWLDTCLYFHRCEDPHFAREMYHGQKHTSFSTDYVRNTILVLISIFISAGFMKWHLELESWTEKLNLRKYLPFPPSTAEPCSYQPWHLY